ncbi:MAG: DUF4326 domain-containing protein [Nocardioides sp.]
MSPRPPSGPTHTALPDDPSGDNQAAVQAYQADLVARPDLIAAARTELAGCDLGCWCPPEWPCHADILLQVANEPDRMTRSVQVCGSAGLGVWCFRHVHRVSSQIPEDARATTASSSETAASPVQAATWFNDTRSRPRYRSAGTRRGRYVALRETAVSARSPGTYSTA